MTWRARIFIALLVLACGACYRPKLAGESFYCHPGDLPACPDGQTCVGDRCVTPGYAPPGVGGGSIDLAGPDDAAIADASPDLSTHAPPPDLSAPPPDLSPSCIPSGGTCTPYHSGKACCSNYCVYSGNKCQ